MKSTLLALLLCSTSLLPATARADGAPDPVVDAAAVEQIETGDLDGAAQAVAAANTAPRDSLVWFQQSALALLARAEEAKAAGEYVAEQRFAEAAILLVAHGLAKSGAGASAGDRAAAYTFIADACERHLGDIESARQNYLGALRELPVHAMARAALARLDEETHKAQRIGNRGNGQ